MGLDPSPPPLIERDQNKSKETYTTQRDRTHHKSHTQEVRRKMTKEYYTYRKRPIHIKRHLYDKRDQKYHKKPTQEVCRKLTKETYTHQKRPAQKSWATPTLTSVSLPRTSTQSHAVRRNMSKETFTTKETHERPTKHEQRQI